MDSALSRSRHGCADSSGRSSTAAWRGWRRAYSQASIRGKEAFLNGLRDLLQLLTEVLENDAQEPLDIHEDPKVFIPEGPHEAQMDRPTVATTTAMRSTSSAARNSPTWEV